MLYAYILKKIYLLMSLTTAMSCAATVTSRGTFIPDMVFSKQSVCWHWQRLASTPSCLFRIIVNLPTLLFIGVLPILVQAASLLNELVLTCCILVYLNQLRLQDVPVFHFLQVLKRPNTNPPLALFGRYFLREEQRHDLGLNDAPSTQQSFRCSLCWR